METLFTKDYLVLWVVVLALALYYPLRQLIWVLYLRRASRQKPPDEQETRRLKKRANVSAALISFVFSFLYTSYLFQGSP